MPDTQNRLAFHRDLKERLREVRGRYGLTVGDMFVVDRTLTWFDQKLEKGDLVVFLGDQEGHDDPMRVRVLCKHGFWSLHASHLLGMVRVQGKDA